MTRLELAPDMSQVSVEATFWVRAGADRWVPFSTRTATVRPDDVPANAGANIAADPQVQSAFSLVQALGLGHLAPELKERSLKMGAATQQALGTARGALSQDLNLLMLPVFDAATDAPAPGSTLEDLERSIGRKGPASRRAGTPRHGQASTACDGHVEIDTTRCFSTAQLARQSLDRARVR